MFNYKKILLLISIILIILIIIGTLFGLPGLLAGVFTLLISCVFYIFINADEFILYLYRARPVLYGEFPEIIEKTTLLSKRAGVPLPSIYITELQLPGSFVVGKNISGTSLVFPVRLSDLLNDEELEALLAHNIIQINGYIYRKTIVTLIAGILTMSSPAIRWGAVFTGFGDYDEPAPKLFGLFMMGLAAPPAAALVHSLKQEEYDAEAAELCRNPDGLVSAIVHLESNNVTAYSSLGFLCLVDPQKETFFEYLFNYHLPKEIRIKNLRGNK